MKVKVSSSTLQKLPKVYLFHRQLKGRIAVASNHAPRFLWQWDTNDDCLFWLVPISSLKDPSVVEPATKIETRSEFMRKLKEEYKYVAILSYRNEFLSSTVQDFKYASIVYPFPTYASEITKYEIFKVDYHREKNTFSFCSWDGKYLTSQWLKGMDVFLKWRSEPSDGNIAEKRSWEVRCVLNTPPGYERIEFMGVANREDYEFYRSAEGSGLVDEEINSFREYLFSQDQLQLGRSIFSQDQLQVGRSMIRIDNQRNLRYFYLRMEKNLGFIVVVTLGFSAVVAAECLHDLIPIHHRYRGEILKNMQNIMNHLEKIMHACDCMQEFTPEGPAQNAKEAINNLVNSSRDLTKLEVKSLGQEADRSLKETTKLRAKIGNNTAEYAEHLEWGRCIWNLVGKKAVPKEALIVGENILSPAMCNLGKLAENLPEKVANQVEKLSAGVLMEGLLDCVAPGVGLAAAVVMVPVTKYTTRALGNMIYAIEPSNEFWRCISHVQEGEAGRLARVSVLSWPLNTPPGDERIEFVGVANRENYKMRRIAEGSDIVEEEINSFREYLFGQDPLQVKRSISKGSDIVEEEINSFREYLFGKDSFQARRSNIRIVIHRKQRHYYLRMKENLGFVVVVTHRFSAVLAAKCFHNLIETHHLYGDNILRNVKQIELKLGFNISTLECMENSTLEGIAHFEKEMTEIFLIYNVLTDSDSEDKD